MPRVQRPRNAIMRTLSRIIAGNSTHTRCRKPRVFLKTLEFQRNAARQVGSLGKSFVQLMHLTEMHKLYKRVCKHNGVDEPSTNHLRNTE